MASKEEIERQQRLLAQYRSNLATLLQQKAMHGGTASAPLVILNSIDETRAEIGRIKKILRDWKQSVEERPDDKPSRKDIQRQLKLLGQDRQNLATLLRQHAMQGEASAPLDVLKSIAKFRHKIRLIKKIIRGWGQLVEDQAGDVVSKEDIQQQSVLLGQHRSNLAQLLDQKAQYGITSTPLTILNRIDEARAAIHHIKAVLHVWEQSIEEHPDDLDAWDWDKFQVQAGPEIDWKNAAKQYMDELGYLYGTVRILGMPEPMALDEIFTDVYLLDKPSAWRHYNINELQRRGFVAEDGASYTGQRNNGLNEVKRKRQLYVLGKPGAGKTTFLKYLTLQAIEGRINAIPIFVSLKSWADSHLDLMNYMVRQFAICSFPNAELFINNILRQGRAIVLLDGLDEVGQEQQKDGNIVRTIRDFTEQYNKSRCVMTCRIAASEYEFEQFTYCELSDFTTDQMYKFATKWFRDIAKRDAFLNEFARPEHAGLRDLARTPLLLTLLCINFDETMSFPARRVEIYEEALDALLKKWDSSRSIHRDIIYKQLSLWHKRQLLTHIAAETFEKNEIFMRQADVEQRISVYLRSLPTDDTTEPIDNLAILKAIEAQHGLLVERAKGIYSFSHLTFHEYFTARYIVEHPSERTFRYVTIKVSDPRWREVLLLTASMLNAENAEIFFGYFIETLNSIIRDDANLIALLAWVAQESTTHGHAIFTITVFYLCSVLSIQLIDEVARARAHVHARARNRVRHSALAASSDHARDRALANDLDSAISFARALSSDLTFAQALVKVLTDLSYRTPDRIFENDQVFSRTNPSKTSMVSPAVMFDHQFRLFTTLVTAQIRIAHYVNDSSLTQNIHTIWHQVMRDVALHQLRHHDLSATLENLTLPDEQAAPETWHNYLDQLQHVSRSHSNLKQSWQLSTAQYERLYIYLQGLALLLECLDLATVANREGIRNRLLQPPAGV